MFTGIELIAEERQRQKDAEGYTRQHDSEHINCELAYVASYYAAPENIYVKEETENNIYFSECWPRNWDKKYNKKNKHNRIRQLVIAGALIAAEIDRIQDMETD